MHLPPSCNVAIHNPLILKTCLHSDDCEISYDLSNLTEHFA